MGHFGQSLKKFREKRKISKVRLSKKIGTSDAYIRQIENQDYKPPTFSVCEKISNELSLNEIEKKELYENAFLERISSEKEFYNFLKHDIYTIKDKSNKIEIKFNPLIFKPIKDNLTTINKSLNDQLLESGIQFHGSHCSTEAFYFTMEAPIEDRFYAQLKYFMKESSEIIKNIIPGFENVNNIWNSYDVLTRNTSTVKVANSNLLEHVT
ncbi:MAG: helix-turn-helix domain-containing protein [Candidatus Margulisiibacteriota bacterium]